MNKNILRPAAGLLLSLAVALIVTDALLPGPWRVASGVAAWAAGALLWRGINAPARRQALALSGLGVLGLVWGALHDVAPNWARVAAANAPLIGMLAAVSFLRLVTRPPEADANAQPGGKRGILTTLLGVHLFGAVINMSTVFIVAERIKRGASLDSVQVRLLTRGFSTAAFWSPFFAAMAAALTFAPGARLEPLLMVGIPLAALALMLTYRELAAEAASSFRGYPVRFGSLWLPGLLAALVLLLHQWLPEVPILALISLLAPSLSLVVLVLRREHVTATVARHLREGLPAMGSELALFLSAGVLAVGLGSMFATFGNWVPFEHFGGLEAGLTLAAKIGRASCRERV